MPRKAETGSPLAVSQVDAWIRGPGPVRFSVAGATEDGYALIGTWSIVTLE